MTDESSSKAGRPPDQALKYEVSQRKANSLSDDSGDKAVNIVTMVLLGATIVGAVVKLGLNWTTG